MSFDKFAMKSLIGYSFFSSPDMATITDGTKLPHVFTIYLAASAGSTSSAK